MQALTAAYILAGCGFWIVMAALILRTLRAVPVLSAAHPPEPERWPRISMIIPARNEQEEIGPAVRSRLGDAYPELEVVVINDRSDDATGRVIDTLAAEDDRIVPVHLDHLPEGWLGKVHAMQCGLERATGEWVLFTDADVHAAPGTLRCAMSLALDERLDHLTILPELWPTTPLVDGVLSSFGRIFTPMTRFWSVRDQNSPVGAGVGAFNLARREALEESDGLEWLRLEIVDDMALGVMLKRCGARSAIVNGRGLLGLHWYRRLPEIARGFEKSYVGVDCRAWLGVIVFLIASAIWLAPWVALAGSGWLQLIGLGTILETALAGMALNRWMGRRIWSAMVYPLGDLILLLLFLRAIVLGHLRGGIRWRGTLYPAARLREGKRLWTNAAGRESDGGTKRGTEARRESDEVTE